MGVPEGFDEYKKREFCKDIQCEVQVELNKHPEGSEEYEKIRVTCKADCKHGAHEFHKWLNEHSYIIIKSQKEGD